MKQSLWVIQYSQPLPPSHQYSRGVEVNNMWLQQLFQFSSVLRLALRSSHLNWKHLEIWRFKMHLLCHRHHKMNQNCFYCIYGMYVTEFMYALMWYKLQTVQTFYTFKFVLLCLNMSVFKMRTEWSSKFCHFCFWW